MRNYGRFTTGIFRDDDFRALTREQQGAYFMLGLQSDVSAAGVLSLTLRRWSQTAANETPADLEKSLDALDDHGHLRVDELTEELLIVKFIKWDGGWSNSKRLPVVIEAVRAIQSSTLRHIAVDELRKLAASLPVPRAASVTSAATTTEGIKAREALSDALSGFDRVVVTEGDQRPQPLTAIQGGEPPTADASDGPPSMTCSKHPNGTEDSCGPCGTARKLYGAWVAAKLEREVAARKAAAEARDACPDCDERGMRLDPNSRQPVGRCDHRRTA